MLLTLAFSSALLAQVVRPQPGPPPPPPPPRGAVEKPLPQGQRIEAQDGDTIVVRGDARVKFVYRREAHVRAISNAAQHWVVLLADYATNGGPDGGVDQSYSFAELEGEWPLGERWEGSAVIDEYGTPGEMGSPGVGLTTSAGFIQILRAAPMSRPDRYRDDRAALITAMSFGRGGGGSRSFDEAERVQVQSAMSNYERNKDLPRPPGFGGMGMSSSISAQGGAAVGSAVGGIPASPLRVGGNIRQPERLVYVPPVLPEQARQAGIQGVVIVEVTIGTDGTVTQARVLRSIPMLDAAALAAVKQWRYEPTLLNGAPVPVVMTVTVNFP